MNRILVVPIAFAEDVAPARHGVRGAPAGDGAWVAVDVADIAQASGVDLPAIVSELAEIASGNGQRLVILTGKDTGVGFDRSPDLRCEPDLSAFLATLELPPGRSFEVSMELPARLDYVSAVRRHLARGVAAASGGVGTFQVEILVGELCLNAVENSPSPHDTYEVRSRCEGSDLAIEVTNVFDATADTERIMQRRVESFDDSGKYLGERGRGLFIVARIADSLNIRSLDGDRIRVAVTKHLDKAPASANASAPSPVAGRSRGRREG